MKNPVKKILKICLILVILILVCFAVPLIYKLNIVLKQAKAYDEFGKGNNFKYVYESSSDEKGFCVNRKITTYTKDGETKLVSEEKDSRGDEWYKCEYWIGKEVFFVDEKNKEFSISENSFPEGFLEGRSGRLLFVYNFTQAETFLEALSYIPVIMPDKMVSEKYEGKDCYKCIYRKQYDEVTDEHIIYIDKETYLPICEIERMYELEEKLSENIEKMSYEKDVVTEADVTMPDLSEYKQRVSYVYEEGDNL